jgi:chorismate synthase
VLADVSLEKFGGDSVVESARNHRSYLDGLPSTIQPREWSAE